MGLLGNLETTLKMFLGLLTEINGKLSEINGTLGRIEKLLRSQQQCTTTCAGCLPTEDAEKWREPR